MDKEGHDSLLITDSFNQSPNCVIVVYLYSIYSLWDASKCLFMQLSEIVARASPSTKYPKLLLSAFEIIFLIFHSSLCHSEIQPKIHRFSHFHVCSFCTWWHSHSHTILAVIPSLLHCPQQSLDFSLLCLPSQHSVSGLVTLTVLGT